MKEILNFHLNNQDIQTICDRIREEMAEAKLSRKEILRVSLLTEEALLNAQAHFGTEQVLRFEWTVRFSRRTVTMVIPGEAYHPLEEKDQMTTGMIAYMMAGEGLLPAWKYRNGSNIIGFSFQKKKKSLNPVASLLIAVMLAVLTALLCKVLPENIGLFLTESITLPLYDKFIGIINAIAGPLVFLSVMWGIFSIGDMASLSKVGSKMILRFVVMLTIITAIGIIVILPFYPVTVGGGSGFVFSELFKMILDIIPENALTPFTENNPMQIIFIAVVVGIAALLLSDKTTVVTNFVEQANYIVQLIMTTITKMIPAFIFFSIFNLISSDNLSFLLNSWELVLTTFSTLTLALVIYTFLVCTRKKISPVLLWKKLFPTFFIAVTTASSSAAFATNMETCEKDLGIDSKLVNIGIPLGQVVFMIGSALLYSCVCLYFAKYYDFAVTPTWLVTLLLVSVILAIASPPIPGGDLIAYTVLFSQMGIPVEAMTICAALNVIFDFMVTAVSLSTLQMEMIELAGRLNYLDIKKLRRVKH